jgi:proteasome activator subunit 4
MLCEKIGSGWLAWAPTVDLFVVPQGMSSLEDKWTLEHRDSIAIYREHAMDSKFWRALSKHFSAENHAQSLSQDHVSCVKSICTPYSLRSMTDTNIR